VTTFFVFIRRKFVCFSLLGDRSSSISPFRLMRNFRLVNFFFIVRKSKIGDHANEIFFCSICKYMNFVFNTKKKNYDTVAVLGLDDLYVFLNE
jgi:hypothetical protein